MQIAVAASCRSQPIGKRHMSEMNSIRMANRTCGRACLLWRLCPDDGVSGEYVERRRRQEPALGIYGSQYVRDFWNLLVLWVEPDRLPKLSLCISCARLQAAPQSTPTRTTVTPMPFRISLYLSREETHVNSGCASFRRSGPLVTNFFGRGEERIHHRAHKDHREEDSYALLSELCGLCGEKFLG
jgi:hypothetical protein